MAVLWSFCASEEPGGILTPSHDTVPISVLNLHLDIASQQIIGLTVSISTLLYFLAEETGFACYITVLWDKKCQVEFNCSSFHQMNCSYLKRKCQGLKLLCILRRNWKSLQAITSKQFLISFYMFAWGHAGYVCNYYAIYVTK